MAAKPNIEEIQAACSSDNLATTYKFLFNSEVNKDRSFVNRLQEERAQLHNKIEKRERTIMETHWFGPFNEKAVDGLRGLVELQHVDRQPLLALGVLIDTVHDGIVENERQVGFMEVDEDLSDG